MNQDSENLQDPEELLSQAEYCLELNEASEDSLNLYINARNLFEEQGEEEKAQEAQWEVEATSLILSPRFSREKGGEVLRETFTLDNGVKIPDISTFSDESLDFYQKRMDESASIRQKARYADILWTRKKDYASALVAVEQYILLSDRLLDQGEVHQSLIALDRAVEIAISLSNAELQNNTYDATLKHLKLFRQGGHVRWYLELTEIFATFSKDDWDDGDTALIIESLVEGAAHFEDAKNYHLQRSFLIMLANIKRDISDVDDAKEIEKRVCHSFEVEAETNETNSFLVASSFYGEALSCYRNLGGSKDKEDELKIKIQACKEKARDNDFSPISVEVELPPGLAELRKQIVESGVQAALEILSVHPQFIPNIYSIYDRLEVSKREHVFLHLLAGSVMDEDGGEIPYRTPEEKDEFHFDHSADMDCLFIVETMVLPILLELSENGDLNAEVLSEFLVEGDLISEEDIKLIKVGIERFFEMDYVSCIHVLVPRLEEVIRSILPFLGLPTTAVMDNGVIRQKQLDTVLKTPELHMALGERETYYLDKVLNRRYGNRLRHRVAHGLLSFDDCSSQIATLLIHLLLVLSKYRIQKET